MTSWCTTRLGTRRSGIACVVGLLLGVSACSDSSPQQNRTPAAVVESSRGSAAQAPLAELRGPNGLNLTITSAMRDAAGYLTVRGNLTNRQSEVSVVPAELRGHDLDVLRTGPSLAGATLVDFARSKRYYVLRDTEGLPLTTTGLTTLKAGESARVFMQFPAPPASTRTVGIQLPLFDTADIAISG